jgi:hypothetical protein
MEDTGVELRTSSYTEALSAATAHTDVLATAAQPITQVVAGWVGTRAHEDGVASRAGDTVVTLAMGAAATDTAHHRSSRYTPSSPDDAGWLSHAMLGWVWPVIKEGWNRPLTSADMPTLMRRMQSAVVGDKVEACAPPIPTCSCAKQAVVVVGGSAASCTHWRQHVHERRDVTNVTLTLNLALTLTLRRDHTLTRTQPPALTPSCCSVPRHSLSCRSPPIVRHCGQSSNAPHTPRC